MPNHGVAPNMRHPMRPVVPYSCYNIKNTWRRSAGAAGSLTKHTTILLDAINCYNRDHTNVVGSSWCKLSDNSVTTMEHLRCHSGLLDWTPAARQLISHTKVNIEAQRPTPNKSLGRNGASMRNHAACKPLLPAWSSSLGTLASGKRSRYQQLSSKAQ